MCSLNLGIALHVLVASTRLAFAYKWVTDPPVLRASNLKIALFLPFFVIYKRIRPKWFRRGEMNTFDCVQMERDQNLRWIPFFGKLYRRTSARIIFWNDCYSQAPSCDVIDRTIKSDRTKTVRWQIEIMLLARTSKEFENCRTLYTPWRMQRVQQIQPTPIRTVRTVADSVLFWWGSRWYRNYLFNRCVTLSHRSGR